MDAKKDIPDTFPFLHFFLFHVHNNPFRLPPRRRPQLRSQRQKLSVKRQPRLRPMLALPRQRRPRQRQRRRLLSERPLRRRPPRRLLRRRPPRRRPKPRPPLLRLLPMRRSLLLRLRLRLPLPRPRPLSSINLQVVRLALVLSRVAKLVARCYRRRSSRLVLSTS